MLIRILVVLTFAISPAVAEEPKAKRLLEAYPPHIAQKLAQRRQSIRKLSQSAENPGLELVVLKLPFRWKALLPDCPRVLVHLKIRTRFRPSVS